MRKTTMWALAAAVAMLAGTASAHGGEVPPVMVGNVVITGSEAEKMLDVLAHHRHHHYHYAGAPLDWLTPSTVIPSPSHPAMPLVAVGQTYITGREAEAMISKLSRMRRHGRYRAGDPLDWLFGGPVVAMPVPMPVPVPPPAPVVMVAPPPMPVPVPPPPPPPAPVKLAEPDLGRSMVGILAQGSPEYAAVGLGLTMEGRRWGFNLNANATVYHVADGDTRQTNFKLVDAHLVFAPISRERGRVRLEVGAAAALDKSAIMFAPDVGISGDVRIIGPFGLLGAVHGSVWPYKRLDVFGGAFLKLWVFRVEAGWRFMRLDAELKNGERVCDSWNGPFLGTTLVF